MRRLVVGLLGVCLLSAFSGMACGEGFGHCERGFGLRNASLDAEVGYQGYTRPLALIADGAQLSVDPVTGWADRLPADGLWLALAARSNVNDLFGVTFTGSWLIPSNRTSAEGLDIAGSQAAGRQFTPSTQWWTLDGMATFALYSSANPVIGLRYDSYYTKFTNSTNTVLSVYAPGDESDLAVYAVLPYVGLVMNQGPINVGMIGLPAVIGQIRWGSTAGRSFTPPGNWARWDTSFSFERGYFLEIFASMSSSNLNLSGLNMGKMGIFAKYTIVHGTAANSVDITPGQPGSFSPPYSSSASIGLDRATAVIAGTFTFDFTSPL